MAVEAGFMGVEAFAAGPGSQAFAAGVGSAAFAGGALGSFAAMAVFLAVVVFSVPVSMGTRGGGVIPIIGVTRITHITRHTTVTMGMGTRRSPEEGVMLALLFRIA
jgi:hypothetical protein